MGRTWSIGQERASFKVKREGRHAWQGSKGTSTDKLRLALVFLLTCESLPSDGDYERVTAALAAAGADTSALAYVRRMRRLNLTGRAVCSHQKTDSLIALSCAEEPSSGPNCATRRHKCSAGAHFFPCHHAGLPVICSSGSVCCGM